jgi:fimbrial chaperone protein
VYAAAGVAMAVSTLAPAAALITAAALINIAPTKLVLTRGVTSTSTQLRNDSDAQVRFQVSAVRWANKPSGEMDLAPTDDLIFFPSLFAIEPHQSRRLRVASSVRATERELAYRVLIEQLPDADRQPGQGVQMLVRASVPVFIQPPTLIARATLDSLALANGVATFSVHNSGTIHLMLREAIVRGRLANGSESPEQRVTGWYLLPGDTRQFRVPIEPAPCRGWTGLSVTVQFSEALTAPLTERVAVPTGACGP